MAFGAQGEKLLHWALYISEDEDVDSSGSLYHIAHAVRGEDDEYDEDADKQPMVYKVKVYSDGNSPMESTRHKHDKFLSMLTNEEVEKAIEVFEETEIEEDADCISWVEKVVETLKEEGIIEDDVSLDGCARWPAGEDDDTDEGECDEDEDDDEDENEDEEGESSNGSETE